MTSARTSAIINAFETKIGAAYCTTDNMREIHIYPEDPVSDGQSLTRSVRIEKLRGKTKRLWHRFPLEYAPMLTDSMDPFVIGTIFLAMRNRANLVVHGTVSPSLIRGLSEYQAYWYCVARKKYARIEITADELKESTTIEGERSLTTFTGGLDSTYTIYRHKSGLCGQAQRQIDSALFVHGFDIPLEDEESFHRVAALNRETLGSVDIKLLTMATNQKEINPDWNDTHGAGIASCLAFFQRAFCEGIIPGSFDYKHKFVWGSNPTSDHLLSSKSFQIVHDCAVWTRVEKLIPLRNWPLAYNRMRVCFSGEEHDKNCGKCAKCALTMLTIKLARLPMPESFPTGLSDQTFDSLKDMDEPSLATFEHLLSSVPLAPVLLPHAAAVKRCLKANRSRLSSPEQTVSSVSRQLTDAKVKLRSFLS